jgi:hypothetical protein
VIGIKNRSRVFFGMLSMPAHQREIREQLTITDPREVAHSLEGFVVQTISRHDARQIILRYEWLGTMGNSTYFVGLVSPTHELFGVACFGYGPGGPIRKLIGGPALCLERGACVHYAPRNAASFLINNACKLIHRITGIPLFFAYADPRAREYGGVYQAAGWLYLGQGLNGYKGRKERIKVLAPGDDPNIETNWKTTREFRRAYRGWRLKFQEARVLGWQIARYPAKHVYAFHVGRDRRKWRRKFSILAYPAPNPLLKLSHKRSPNNEPLRLSAPPVSQSCLFTL